MSIMVTFHCDKEKPTIQEAAQIIGVEEKELNQEFGVSPLFHDADVFVVLVEDEATKNIDLSKIRGMFAKIKMDLFNK